MNKLKVCGIICEYNPFHYGHAFQLSEARKAAAADYVIAVMSGDFVQRGEPAVINKWARAEMALKLGADMVLELPPSCAVSSAEYFASGAVGILQNTGIVTHISFGSESFEGQKGAAELLEIARKTPSGPVVDKDSLKKGASFAAASRDSVVAQPNDVLATEYLRAMQRLAAKMEIVPVRRKGDGYNGEGSAMHIRNMIFKGQLEQVEKYMPKEAFDILKREFNEGRGPIKIEDFDKIVLADLRRLGVEGLSKSPFISEGLEYKIFDAACRGGTIASVVEECTSKRYTSSRIRRIAFASMLGILRKNVETRPPYIRVLGMRRDCGALMEALNSSADIPIVTSKAKFLKDAEDTHSEAVREFLKIESTAADLYALAYPSSECRQGASELTHPLVFV